MNNTNKIVHNPFTGQVANAFCPTGEGGGVDSSCGGSGFAKKHNIKLPTSKKRLSIDQAKSALDQMGFKLGDSNATPKGVSYEITKPDGSKSWMHTDEIKKLVYEGRS